MVERILIPACRRDMNSTLLNMILALSGGTATYLVLLASNRRRAQQK